MAIESMYVFTGDEVVATDLPAKLNENFAKTETNMLKTVNNVAQDENHNINVTELIPKQITSNTNLNNLVTSGEYTFTKGSATITNSPTPNSFFLTVLRNNALVKQVVTEVVLDDPITYTRVLSGSSWSPWVEGGKVKTINSIKPDDSGNVDLSSMDYAVRSEIGIWKPSEEVSVGDVRYLNGRENAGIVLECIEAGTTGSEQPTISDNTDNIIANFTSNDRIGHMRLIFNLAEKDADEIIALGIAYNRTTYPELWEYVQSRPDLLLTETEWQAKYAETNGKFVPYYSSGNGTSTFRTPLLSAYAKGADSVDGVGNYLEAGLPNITGGQAVPIYRISSESTDTIWSGALGKRYVNQSKADMPSVENDNGFYNSTLFLDASRANPIYGNSDTVAPETMQGIWVIKAIGIIIDNNNTDISNVLNGITEFESKVIPIEKGGTNATSASQACANIGALPTSGGTMTGGIYFNNPDFGITKDSNSYGGYDVGWSWGDKKGSGVGFRGIDYTKENERGAFSLYARNETNSASLDGYPDGNLRWNNKEIALKESLSMPSSNYINISISGFVANSDSKTYSNIYTALVDGWAYIYCTLSSSPTSGYKVVLHNSTKGYSVRYIHTKTAIGRDISFMMPMSKGDVLNIETAWVSSIGSLRFYYAKSGV